MIFYLHNELKPHFTGSSQQLFDQVMALCGDAYRQMDGRLTQRVCIGGKYYFIKQHTGVGWKEIIKNVMQGRAPIVSAKNEWQALAKLAQAGISVPKVLGYGLRGINPARLQSFVLLEDLSPMQSLEELCPTWEKSPPTFKYKQKLIAEVARVAKAMHGLGINHRDFYLCHFLLRENKLYLLDLHRAAIRRCLPERWRIKDLAGLYFSSKYYVPGFNRHDMWRFVRIYTGKTLRNIFLDKNNSWQKVKTRGERLYDKHD